jgi:hypothetical protein
MGLDATFFSRAAIPTRILRGAGNRGRLRRSADEARGLGAAPDMANYRLRRVDLQSKDSTRPQQCKDNADVEEN